MKLALCTSDFFRPVQDSIRAHGHEVEFVVTSCDMDSGFSSHTRAFAEEMRAQFRVGKVSEEDIKAFTEAGVELLVSAAYDYKIPTPLDSPIKFVNVHGSLLPEGRGPWPQPWILLGAQEAAGVTFHSMTQSWDRGDILLQREIPLNSSETLDSFVAKTILVVRELSDRLFSDFATVWANRRPMVGEGSYWGKPTITDRSISLDMTVHEVDRIYRAFGEFTLIEIPDKGGSWQVKKLTTWASVHSYAPGESVAVSPPLQVFALRDGYVGLVLGSELK